MKALDTRPESEDGALFILFESKLKPKLENLDTIRQTAVKRFWLSLFIVFFVGLTSFIVAYLTRHELGLAMLPTCGAIAVMAFYYSNKWNEYRNSYKKHVVEYLLKTFDESFNYNPNRAITPEQYKKSRLYRKKYDRFGGEDYASGMLGKTAIEFSELHTEYKTVTRDSKGNRKENWHTIFQGLFFVADANKHFQGATYILPDSKGLFSSIGKIYTEKLGKMGERVSLENPEFEEHFEVYSDDQVEARYLVSSTLMQRILDFKKQSGDLHVSLSFVEGCLYVAIYNSKAYFEPKLFEPAASFHLVESIYKDIQFITGIVDDLDLNTRIWTK
ncbi:DUF3137 domain-containing protein [Vibrio sp. Of7-15]|uniref:DUF3137 domain-containing protein n=1 Tax=Vibrio sp. Of7-15 TaxID=2724879 RepID=UPI001EF28977|nr:DUF3137 domain-containing protein [Vibrio sp. Of7-15]MCG7499987.1 DUF3137 domain-containing protein [Vibrio sp. Of7-15]